MNALTTPVDMPLNIPHPPGPATRTKQARRALTLPVRRLLTGIVGGVWLKGARGDMLRFSATSGSRWSVAPTSSGDTQPASRHYAESALATGATSGASVGGEPPYAQQIRAQVDGLYQRHARAVLGYLCQRLPHQADAEDALAEVFSAALQACARGQTPDLPWLLTVARRRVADFYRARQRHGGIPLERGLDAAEALAWPADLQDDPEWRALHDEQSRELAELLARLPADQREAIALRFAAGLPSAQIAVALGKTDDATRALLSRAMRRLREGWQG